MLNVDSAFLLTVFVVAVLSGGTAAIAGFGIGSLLTPLLTTELSLPTAIAAVSMPHAAATALRYWRLRKAVDRMVLRGFGLLSAAGGLLGALLYAYFPSSVLTVILGLLLVTTSIATLTDWISRWPPTGPTVGVLGLLSGVFGGLAGNQGGLRAAALLSFDLSPASYVATSTAIALMVDMARTPVYLWKTSSQLLQLVTPLLIASGGVLAGTLLGERILLGMSRKTFRKVVGSVIGLLGIWILFRMFS